MPPDGGGGRYLTGEWLFLISRCLAPCLYWD